MHWSAEALKVCESSPASGGSGGGIGGGAIAGILLGILVVVLLSAALLGERPRLSAIAVVSIGIAPCLFSYHVLRSVLASGAACLGKMMGAAAVLPTWQKMHVTDRSRLWRLRLGLGSLTLILRHQLRSLEQFFWV